VSLDVCIQSCRARSALNGGDLQSGRRFFKRTCFQLRKRISLSCAQETIPTVLKQISKQLRHKNVWSNGRVEGVRSSNGIAKARATLTVRLYNNKLKQMTAIEKVL